MFLRRSLLLVVALLVVASPALAEEEQWGTLRGQFLYDGEPPALKMFDNAKVRQDYGEPIPDESLLVDPENSGLANIAVWLLPKKDEPLNIHPSYADIAERRVEIHIDGGRYHPRVVSLCLPQKLIVENREHVGDALTLSPPSDRPP